MAGLWACPFGVSVIAARGQAWKPAPTGLGSKSGMPVQRQILCVGADRCVRPHRETTRTQSIEQRKCRSYFRWPLVGADLCACPVGVLVIVARGQAWKPAPTGLGSISGLPVQQQILCVGADRRVRPHVKAMLLSMTPARRMPNVCWSGLLIPNPLGWTSVYET